MVLADYFELKDNGTELSREVLAGSTTFLSAMYIIVVNPAILVQAGLPFNASLTAAVLVSAFSSVLMGLYANNPLVVAPGMSLNHIFVLAASSSSGISYRTALGCVFWSGVLFFLLLTLDRKKRLLGGVPRMLRYGLAGGIGLFIAVIGLESAGFIVYEPAAGFTRVEMNAHTLTFLAGLAVASILVVRKIPAGFILAVLITTVLAWPLGRLYGFSVDPRPPVAWQGVWAWPDFSLIGQMDLLGALTLPHWPLIFVFSFSCLFDSLATCVGVCEAGDLVDEEGDPRRLVTSLKANAVGVIASGLLGASPATAYIESSTGVRVGGRTGLTAVTAGLLFMPLLFLSPLLSLVPALATAPILVLAGIFMLKPLIYVRWERFDDAAPFFMAMIVTPLSHSITHGIIWGCLSWTALKLASGKRRQITPSLIFLDVVSLLLLFTLDRYGH